MSRQFRGWRWDSKAACILRHSKQTRRRRLCPRRLKRPAMRALERDWPVCARPQVQPARIGSRAWDSHRMMAYYEAQTRHPPAALLPLLARTLKVSADELLGLQSVTEQHKPPAGRLWRRFKKSNNSRSRSAESFSRSSTSFLSAATLGRRRSRSLRRTRSSSRARAVPAGPEHGPCDAPPQSAPWRALRSLPPPPATAASPPQILAEAPNTRPAGGSGAAKRTWSRRAPRGQSSLASWHAARNALEPDPLAGVAQDPRLRPCAARPRPRQRRPYQSGQLRAPPRTSPSCPLWHGRSQGACRQSAMSGTRPI